MPYTRITPTAYGRDAIMYAKGGYDEKGHNGAAHRNVYVGSVGMMPESIMSYEDQMQKYWNLASSRNKTQVQRIVCSFSPNELPPDDSNSPLKAMAIAQEYFEEYYPDRQVAIFVQNDGQGGKIHFHGLVNNVSITDHKGCTDDQRHFSYIQKTFDKVAERYIELDKGDTATKDKVSQHERVLREKNAQGEDNYIWKDDLKERIRLSMSEAEDRDDYYSKLVGNGVEARAGVSKNHGEYLTYELVDISGFEDGQVPRSLKARSYKLGSDYGFEALDAELARDKSKDEPRPEPVVHQKTEEEFEAERAAQAEADAFVAWCRDNGYKVLTDRGHFSLDSYEEANAAYEEWKLHKDDPVEEPKESEDDNDDSGTETVVETPEVEEVVEEPEVEIEVSHKVDKSDDDEDDDTDIEDEIEEESEEVKALRQRNQQLQEELMRDAEEMEAAASIADELGDIYGPK